MCKEPQGQAFRRLETAQSQQKAWAYATHKLAKVTLSLTFIHGLTSRCVHTVTVVITLPTILTHSPRSFQGLYGLVKLPLAFVQTRQLKQSKWHEVVVELQQPFTKTMNEKQLSLKRVNSKNKEKKQSKS